MSLLAKLKAAQDTTVEVQSGEKDTLGGSRIWDTDGYKVTIELAYMTVAASGANAVNFRFKNADGQELRITEYITSGTAKGAKTYYMSKQGDAVELPGFVTANAIAMATTGKSILEQDDEERVIPLYNYDLKAEVGTPVAVIPDLIGQQVVLGLHKCTVSKNVKGNDGKYVPTAETREENQINKVFNEDGLTSTEVKAGLTEPTFLNGWLDKFKGIVLDRTDKNAPKASAAPAAGGAAKPASSGIFG
jgi:hypothetical protein